MVCSEIKQLEMKLDEYIYWRIMALTRAFGLTHGASLIPFAGIYKDYQT
jgi:hypothetical protein